MHTKQPTYEINEYPGKLYAWLSIIRSLGWGSICLSSLFPLSWLQDISRAHDFSALTTVLSAMLFILAIMPVPVVVLSVVKFSLKYQSHDLKPIVIGGFLLPAILFTIDMLQMRQASGVIPGFILAWPSVIICWASLGMFGGSRLWQQSVSSCSKPVKSWTWFAISIAAGLGLGLLFLSIGIDNLPVGDGMGTSYAFYCPPFLVLAAIGSHGWYFVSRIQLS